MEIKQTFLNAAVFCSTVTKVMASAIMILLITGVSAYAQNINVVVSINTEQLYLDKQRALQGLDRDIKQYIEANRWSDGKVPFSIDVSIKIIIEKIQPSFEDVYSAQMNVASKAAGFSEVDKRWQFPYRINQPLIFNPNSFDGLTGLLNYYMYIIIGTYLDRVSCFGGEDSFSKALIISHLGQADRYSYWWDKREEYVQQYLRDSHKKFRELMYLYNTARYWQSKKNIVEQKSASDSTLTLLSMVSKIQDEEEFIQNFFKMEYANAASLFAPDTSQYNVLMRLDPDHKDFYQNYIKKK